MSLDQTFKHNAIAQTHIHSHSVHNVEQILCFAMQRHQPKKEKKKKKNADFVGHHVQNTEKDEHFAHIQCCYMRSP